MPKWDKYISVVLEYGGKLYVGRVGVFKELHVTLKWLLVEFLLYRELYLTSLTYHVSK
jgi:hypothetical protein